MEMSLSHASGILAIRFSTSSDSTVLVVRQRRTRKNRKGEICISNEDLPSTLQFGIAISEQNGLSTSCTLFFRKFTKHVWRRNWDFGGDKKTENNDRWTLRNAKSVRRSVSLLQFWSQDIGRRDYWGNHVGECS